MGFPKDYELPRIISKILLLKEKFIVFGWKQSLIIPINVFLANQWSRELLHLKN